MRSKTVIARLVALPLRHKVIGLSVALGISVGLSALFLTRPRLYTISSMLSCNLPSEKGAAAQASELAALTSRILTIDALNASAQHLGLSQNPFDEDDAESLKSHLLISAMPPAKVRVAWTGYGAGQVQDAAKAVTYALTSWTPQTHLEQEPPKEDPDQAKEQALLRVTIAMIDVRTAELNSALRQLDSKGLRTEAKTQRNLRLPSMNKSASSNDSQRRGALEVQINQFHSQRLVVEHRLAEGNRAFPVSATASVPAADLHQSAFPTNPFIFLERDSAAQPRHSWLQLEALALLCGAAFAVLYLAASLWWFRPIGSVTALERVLPGNNLLIGVIAEIRR